MDQRLKVAIFLFAAAMVVLTILVRVMTPD
jgi:hypothetical protein